MTDVLLARALQQHLNSLYKEPASAWQVAYDLVGWISKTELSSDARLDHLYELCLDIETGPKDARPSLVSVWRLKRALQIAIKQVGHSRL